MLEHEPMTVQSRGRLYTSREQRDRIGLSGHGRGTDVDVGLVVVDREKPYGTCGVYATYTATVRTDGVIPIPEAVRSDLAISDGDHVRLSARVSES